jgi:hypothetical protein
VRADAENGCQTITAACPLIRFLELEHMAAGTLSGIHMDYLQRELSMTLVICLLCRRDPSLYCKCHKPMPMWY